MTATQYGCENELFLATTMRSGLRSNLTKICLSATIHYISDAAPSQVGYETTYIIRSAVPGGSATCFEGFVVSFLKVPLACLGSMAAEVQPNSLGTLGKHFTKPSEQVATPPSRLRELASAAKDGGRGSRNLGPAFMTIPVLMALMLVQFKRPSEIETLS